MVIAVRLGKTAASVFLSDAAPLQPYIITTADAAQWLSGTVSDWFSVICINNANSPPQPKQMN
jgi:hypothetical protein